MPPRPRILILAEGHFSPERSKTANCVIRYRGAEVAGVLDSTCRARTAREALGFGGGIPVVRTLNQALALRPTEAIVGVAPRGGRLEKKWLSTLERLLREGVHVASGLHEFLDEHPRLVRAAERGGARITELRRWDGPLALPSAKPPRRRALVILTVGSDCNVGKMTATWETAAGLRRDGFKVEIVATGQTGIYLAGGGVPVDALKSDFVAGAVEEAVSRADARRPDFILVEGQGAIHHPAYSAVSLGLLHGARPGAMLLCHMAGRRRIAGYPSYPIPDFRTLVRWHEWAASMVKPAPVAALALNTMNLSTSAAKAALRRAAMESGLPAADPVRFGAAPLARAIREAAKG